MIDSARSDGADISLDTYPYLPGCTTLASLLPSWASAGGPAETLRRIEDEAAREKIRIAIEVTGCDGGHGIPTNWDEIQVRRCDAMRCMLRSPASYGEDHEPEANAKPLRPSPPNTVFVLAPIVVLTHLL